METEHNSARSGIWSRDFTCVFIISFVVNMGQYMMNLLVPQYAASLGATSEIVGLVSGMFAVTSLAVRPFVGPSSQFFRKNRLLAFSIAFILSAYIAYGLSNGVKALLVARLLHGVGMGFLAPVSLAVASDALPQEKLASGIGIFSLGHALSTATGPALGAFLVGKVGYRATFYLTGAFLMIVFVMALCVKTSAPDRSNGLRVSIHSIIAPEVIVPAVMMFFLAGAFSTIGSFLLLYCDARGLKNASLFFTVYALVMLLARPLCGKIADRFGLDKAIVPSILLFAMAYILLSISKSFVSLLIAGALLAFGYGVCQPSMQTLCMSLVKPERRSVAGNTHYIGVDAGLMVTPVVAGAVVTAARRFGCNAAESYAVMYRVMTIPMFIALVLFLLNRKKLLSRERAGMDEKR